ncbi:hypothetical protein HA402_012301 [Bradysia odoriphaga]|nr:hypothetical protein HA402_012301 [Bradysia odoriphaga]
MNNSLPYKVEYSSGGLNCKKCEKKVRSGAVKIAIMMQSEDDDCQYADWYHMKCFFKIRLPKTEAAFDGFAILRYADQQLIKVQLGISVPNRCPNVVFVDLLVNEFPSTLFNQRNLSGNMENTTEKKQTAAPPKAKLPDFHIGYTRSEGESCFQCNKLIRVPEIRVMHVQYVTDLTVENGPLGGTATWYHIPCFVRSRRKLEWLESGELLPGFKRLSEEDKEIVKKQVPVIKRKMVTHEAHPSDSEKLIELQNKEYYALYDQLAKKVTKKDQIEILKWNSEPAPKTRNEILHRLTDILSYGALDSCDKCHGRLYFNNTTYSCSKYLPWGKCTNNVKHPKRHAAFIITMQSKYPFLVNLVRDRALHSFRFEDENGTDLVNAPYKSPPLFNMEFAIIGKLKSSKVEIKEKIRKLGGRVVNKIHDKLAAVISNQEEIDKMEPIMAEAKACNIQIISEDFLSKMEDIDPLTYIVTRSLTDEWGGNPFLRVERNDVKSRRETLYYTETVPDKIRYKLCANDSDKNLVDADSGLRDNAHIYVGEWKGVQMKYIVILGLVDIQCNRNSYCRIQLLEANDKQTYWIFESWGRISTLIGSKRLTSYANAAEACAQFHSLYLEKTGNELCRHPVKKPNKFYHLDIDFNIAERIPQKYIESKLSQPIYRLMKLIFSTKHMKEMMFSCDIDIKQMPLGKIGQVQIYTAMSVLKRIEKLITENVTPGQLCEASNQFYTMIPHGFSVKRPPIIDSMDMVKAKNEMLQNLLNVSMIYAFLEGENGERINPYDACYAKMKTAISPIDKQSIEFQTICDIVRNTHGSTHNQYILEVVEVFKVKRKREDVRSRTYKKLDNHQMLWHGSRLTNFASILSKGLRIAPKEAPSTGYMFGKGIYFADMVSKSANYCSTSYGSGSGLMLLCDVALGKTRDMIYATDVIDLPNDDEQSVKGCGQTYPTEHTMLDGVKIASGGVQTANSTTSLRYNEYIVYDIAQVKMKYLVNLKFNRNRAN